MTAARLAALLTLLAAVVLVLALVDRPAPRAVTDSPHSTPPRPTAPHSADLAGCVPLSQWHGQQGCVVPG